MIKNHQKIAVMGAGIVGLTAAYTLNQTGHAITLFDQEFSNSPTPPANASAMAGGMLAPYAEIEHMSHEWINASLLSLKFWQDFPLDCGFKKTGSLMIAHPQDRYILERFKSHLPDHLKQTINAQEAENALPPHFQNAILLKDEAHLNPQRTMQALYSHLLENGVKFKNEYIKIPKDLNNFDHIIDCRGMGANDKNIRGVKGEILIVRNPEFTINRPLRLMHPRYPLYIVPREEHVFMIGATQVESASDNHVSIRSAMELMSALHAISPSFADAQIIDIKAGIRPAYADNLPRIKIHDNVISCNGLFRHGYLLSPLMAACVTDYLAGQSHQYMHLFYDRNFEGNSDENHDQRAA